MIFKKLNNFFVLVFIFMFILNLNIAFANTENSEEIIDLEKKQIENIDAQINVPEFVELGKKFILSASKTENIQEDSEVQYIWKIGDKKVEGEEIIESIDEVGEFEIKLFVSDGITSDEAYKNIFIYKKKIVLIIDSKEKLDSLEPILQDAKNKGVLIQIIYPKETFQGLGVESSIINSITKESIGELSKIDYWVIWTDDSIGLNVLTNLSQTYRDELNISEKTIFIVTNAYLGIFNRISSRSYSIINSEQLVIIKDNITGLLYNFIWEDEIKDVLYKTSSESQVSIINQDTVQLSPINIFSYIINLGLKNGISGDIIIFLLTIPIITLIIVFLKQIIGLYTGGLYIPTVLALSFIILGLKLGVILFCIIIFTGIFIKFIIQKIHILYIPKLAVIYSIFSLSILFFLILGLYLNQFFNIDLNLPSKAILSVFPMIVITNIGEKFVKKYLDNGFKYAFKIIIFTLFSAIIAYFIANFSFVKTLIFAYPEIIILIIILELIIGRWTGLKIVEYIRFKDIFLYHAGIKKIETEE